MRTILSFPDLKLMIPPQYRDPLQPVRCPVTQLLVITLSTRTSKPRQTDCTTAHGRRTLLRNVLTSQTS